MTILRYRGILSLFVLIIFLLSSILVYKPIPVVATDTSTTNSVIDVRLGSTFALALKSDGTVWSWGSNGAGQLGNGTLSPEYTPRKVQGLSEVVEIDIGASYALALKRDGTVWFWGYNLDGLLGDGSKSNILTPVQVGGLSEVIAISAGAHHILVLKEDGSVWTWGIGKAISQVQGLTKVVAIEAGRSSSYAMTEDGQAWAWGSNDDGQLGDGTRIDKSEPVQIVGLDNVRSIAADRSAYAIKEDGTVWEWGRIIHPVTRQEPTQLVPIQEPNLNNAREIYTSSYSAMALTHDQDLYIWGRPMVLVNGKLKEFPAPEKVEKLGKVRAGALGDSVALAVLEDGSVWMWGKNTSGLAGNGSNEYTISEPIKTLVDTAPNPPFVLSVRFDNGEYSVPIYKKIKKFWVTFSARLDQAGINSNNIRLKDENGRSVESVIVPSERGFSLEVKETLTLGEEYTLEISDIMDVEGYLMEPYRYPFTVQLPLNSYITNIDAGALHSLYNAYNSFYRDMGALAWGNNQFGQLGDGTTINRLLPVQIKGLKDTPAYLTAGGYHSLAVFSDGTLQAWGHNQFGQLGDGTKVNRSLPVDVQGLTDITKVAAGDMHNIALRTDGTVWAWGANDQGQLGDGTLVDRDVPVQVPGLEQIVAIAAGGKHSLAVKADGTVWTWGNNSSGQLGIGDTKNSHYPVQVKDFSGAKSVYAGWMHSFALKEDETLWAWGNNERGQLGDGSTEQRHTPVHVLENVKYLDAGYDHTLAKTEYEESFPGYIAHREYLSMWGDNSLGQLGDISDQEYENTPRKGLFRYSGDSMDLALGGAHSLLDFGTEAMGFGFNASGQLGDGSTYHRFSPTSVEYDGDSIYYRLAGSNRIETAVEISYAGWNYGSQAVVLARDDDFPDALTGTPLAHAVNGPILLTNKNNLSEDTEEEIKRLRPQLVYILGSYGAISEGIEEKLSADYKVIRLGGVNRYETAAKIAEYMADWGLNEKGKAVVAYGMNFPDALSVSSVAAYKKLPILLTDTLYLPEATQKALTKLQVSDTIVIGGKGVIGEKVAKELPKAVRYSGMDRYETALAVAQNMGADSNLIYLATGTNFPDALAGSALAARTNSPIILVNKTMNNIQTQAVGKYLNTASQNQALGLFVLGGTGVISDDMIGSIGNYLFSVVK